MPGIYDRRMFRMANGGMIPPPVPMGAPPAGPMGGGMMDPAMQMAMAAEQLPPEVLQAANQEMGGVVQDLATEEIGAAVDAEVGRSIQNLDGATDFRDIMNTVWDGDADIDTYRGKLADIVGWEDADRTPDSVLALVQPTLQLAAIDQGIGALMQEELAEVGEMGGGIADLAAKGAVAEGMAAETGALVNAVSGMAPTDRPAGAEGAPVDPMMLEAMMQGAGPMDQGMV